jgi:Ca2+:H+ antiporter
MDLAIGICLGSSIQVLLFVTPLLVVVGWIIQKPLSLCFPLLDIAILFLSVFVVTQVIADGESNWLEGLMLLFGYLIIGITYAYV